MFKLLALFLFIAGLGLLGGSFFPALIHPHWHYFNGYNLALGLVAQRLAQLARRQPADVAIYTYLYASMGRLFLSLIAALLYIWFSPETRSQLFPAVGGFFFVYFAYTAVEVTDFLFNLRAHSNSSQPPSEAS
jgi:hypothetical protein